MTDVVTTFEDLSSEIYLCIFDYLDTYYLYKAFIKLNSRLTNMLNDKHLLLTLDTRHSPTEIHIPEYAIHRVRSLTSTINNLLLPSCFHDHIEQITFTGKTMTLSSFEYVFKKLNNLPELSSLVLTVSENTLYHVICNKILFENYLPHLKRFVCNTMMHNLEHKSFTTNQLLSLTVSCTIADLYRIFQCSSQLTYINVSILNSLFADLTQFDGELLKLKRAKLSMAFRIRCDELEHILRRIPNLKYLELSGMMPALAIGSGRSFRELFSTKLYKVELDLSVHNVPGGIDWMQSTIFDVDCYWHNVKWTRSDIFFDQFMQLTALGYESKE